MSEGSARFRFGFVQVNPDLPYDRRHNGEAVSLDFLIVRPFDFFR